MNPFPNGSLKHHVFELLARNTGAITPEEVIALPEFERELALRRPRIDCSNDAVVVRPEDALAVDLERMVKQATLSGQGIPGPGGGELLTIDQRQTVLDAFLIQARVGEYAALNERELRTKAREAVAAAEAKRKADQAAEEKAFDDALRQVVAERRGRQKAE